MLGLFELFLSWDMVVLDMLVCCVSFEMDRLFVLCFLCSVWVMWVWRFFMCLLC